MIAVTEGVEKFTIEGLAEREKPASQRRFDHGELSMAYMRSFDTTPAENLPRFAVEILDMDEEWKKAEKILYPRKSWASKSQLHLIPKTSQ